MRPLGGLLLVAGLLSIGGCGRSTGLLVNVLTDLRAGTELHEVAVDVTSAGYQYSNGGNPWVIGPGQPARLPGSFAIYSERGPVEVTVNVTGYRDLEAIVTRTAILRLEPQKVLYLSVALSRRCVVGAEGGLDKPCDAGLTCIEGVCQSPEIPPGTLQTYEEGLEQEVQCNGGGFVDTADNRPLEDGAGCSDGERCREGACLPEQSVLPPDGGPADGRDGVDGDAPDGDGGDGPAEDAGDAGDADGPEGGGDLPDGADLDGALDADGGDGPGPRTYQALELYAGEPGGCGSVDGTGALARFQNPTGVVADGKGGVYVADANNCSIRHVDAAGVTTTISGQSRDCTLLDGPLAAARFQIFMGQLALDAAGRYLYLAEGFSPGRIRRLDLVAGTVETLPLVDAGSGLPVTLGAPIGLVLDETGAQPRLFVTESSQHTIRAVSIDDTLRQYRVSLVAGVPGIAGFVDTLAGTPQFDAPFGLAFRSGELFVADSNNNAIRHVALSPDPAIVSTLAGLGPGNDGGTDGAFNVATFRDPQSVALLSATDLLVTDGRNSVLRLMDLEAQQVSVFAGAIQLAGAEDGPRTTARFGLPIGISIFGGDIFVADNFACTVRRVDTAAVTTLAGRAGVRSGRDGTGAAARLHVPVAIDLAPDGTAYIADAADFRLRALDTQSRILTTLPLTGATTGMWGGLAFAGDVLFVSDAFDNVIARYDLGTAGFSVIAGSGAEGSADGSGASASFFRPTGVAYDGDGRLYVADQESALLRRLLVDRSPVVVETLAGVAGEEEVLDGPLADARLKKPVGLHFDPAAGSGAGALYFTDDVTVRRLDLDTRSIETVAGQGGMFGVVDGVGPGARFQIPTGLTLDNTGRRLLVADDGAVRAIDLASRQVTTPVGLGRAQRGHAVGDLPALINSPRDLVVLPGGEVLIVDAAENVVLLLR